MRVSRRRKKFIPTGPFFRCNEQIRAPEVRVIGPDGAHIGTLPTAEALKMAEERELDLVEINPKAQPPTAKIMDFGQFKYQKEKEAKKIKSQQKKSTIKGIRLSVRISEHDKNVRLEQSKKFLEEGNKVKIDIILRGRERQHPELAKEQIQGFIKQIEDKIKIKIEQNVIRQGNTVTAILTKE